MHLTLSVVHTLNLKMTRVQSYSDTVLAGTHYLVMHDCNLFF